MKKPEKRLSVTSNDLADLQLETTNEQQLIVVAIRFLNATTSSRNMDNLSPDDLAEAGKLLANPDQLLAGPNLLKWQNIRRKKVGISGRASV